MASYPKLLTSKATLLGNLTRFDLGALGISYMICSYFKLSGLVSLILNSLLILGLGVARRRLKRGFWGCINAPRVFFWRGEVPAPKPQLAGAVAEGGAAEQSSRFVPSVRFTPRQSTLSFAPSLRSGVQESGTSSLTRHRRGER